MSLLAGELVSAMYWLENSYIGTLNQKKAKRGIATTMYIILDLLLSKRQQNDGRRGTRGTYGHERTALLIEQL